MLWTDKYSPKKISEVVGNSESLVELEEFIFNYKAQKKNSIFIYGPTGSGKTCAVHSIANENNLEVLEINASDVRNKAGINEVIGGSIHQASLFSKGKIILIDEVDGLSGTKDRGGVKALCSLIAESSFPIVLTANDPWSSKLSPLRKKSKLIEQKSNYIDHIISDIQDLKRGAFAPLGRNPIFLAILAPLGGLGTISIMPHLLHLFNK